ncbi:MAG TPA: sialidase family protein, partial [Ignavibacteriaceae bacterium]|nr:sialidase family protein [Ignavibacteriaceae bacterium]
MFAQVSDFQKIELTQKNVKESAILSLSETELILFYLNSTQDSIFSIRSLNTGKSWQSEKFIKSITIILPQEKIYLTAIQVNQNRIILSWSILRDSITYIISDDNGNSWTALKNIGACLLPPYFKRAENLSLVKSDDNVLFLSYSDIKYEFLWLKKSTDSGETWSDLPYIINSGNEKKFNLSVQVEDNLTLHAYYIVNNPNSVLYRVSSTDSGVTWSTPDVIFSFDTLVNSVRTVCTNDKKLWLVYQKKSSFRFSYSPYEVINYDPNDLFYMTSTTFGTNWSAEEQVTKYIGDDNFNNVAAFGNEPIISFTTQRFSGDYNLTFFIPGINKEISTPPCIVHSSIRNIANLKNKIVVSAIVINNEEIKKVEVKINDSGVLGELYDDGLHNDNEANDKIYSNIFDDVRLDNYNSYLIQTNKFRLAVNRNAAIPGSITSAVVTLFLTITDINNFSFYQSSSKNIIIEAPNGYYDNVEFLFTGGFALSGLDSDGIWANGVFTSGLISDYLPGPVGSDPNAIENSIYVVKANDPPFGNSWNVWKKAVELGAEFYDGDNDGIYNPIDKNFNGIW